MYKLTERRFKKAEVILEKYRNQMINCGQISASMLEKELRDCWDTGYREIKYIMEQLLKDKRYVYLAAYYMENSNGSVGVVMEFKGHLADLYGATSFHYDKNYKEKRKSFWDAFQKENKGK